MRKRMVIATIVVVVIGIVVISIVTVAQPKKGTVEWYKKRSEQLHANCFGRTFRWKAAVWFERLTGRELIKQTEEDREKQWKELRDSLEKLEELGFLIRRQYVFTNLPAYSDPEMLLRSEIQHWRRSIPKNQQMFCWVLSGNEVDSHGGRCRVFLWVIAPREHQPEWERVVRKLDVPASGK